MPTRYTENVVQALARHLGVTSRQIALSHDLYRDWGLTPLGLVVVLLDLEQSVSLELACEDFVAVRTVADLVSKFSARVRSSGRVATSSTVRGERRSRSARNERRLRRELHHLRWLEENAKRRALGAARPVDARALTAEQRVESG
jgi:hypothetical protein